MQCLDTEDSAIKTHGTFFPGAQSSEEKWREREREWMNSSGPLGKPGFAYHSTDSTAWNLHLTPLPFGGGVGDL